MKLFQFSVLALIGTLFSVQASAAMPQFYKRGVSQYETDMHLNDCAYTVSMTPHIYPEERDRVIVACMKRKGFVLRGYRR